MKKCFHHSIVANGLAIQATKNYIENLVTSKIIAEDSNNNNIQFINTLILYID